MRTVIDQLNRSIRINDEVSRIISVVPSQTELLSDLGLEEEVIGITKFCIHPIDWFKNKNRVGGTKKLNLEAIRKLEPDIIFANKEENTKEEIDQLSKEFPVWISDIKTVKDSYEMMESIGEICRKEIEAKKIINKIKENFAQINVTTKKKAAYFIWYNPWMAAGNDTFITEMLSLAGFENTITENRYPIMDLLNVQAEILLLSSEPYPFKQKHIEEIKKIHTNAQCLLVDGEMFSWYGSRMLHAAKYFSTLDVLLNSK